MQIRVGFEMIYECPQPTPTVSYTHLDVYKRQLVLNDQAALQPGVVRGDASRAGIGVAAQGLYAAQREHEAARRIHEIGASRQRPGNSGRRHQLPGGDHPDTFFQACLLYTSRCV